MSPDSAPRAACVSGFRCERLETRRMLAVQLVADLNTATLGSEPEEFVSNGSVAYFVARGGGETGLWKSDGTPAGTTLVRGNLATTTYPRNLGLAGPRLYFANTDAARGEELWTSDGTEAGTAFVADLLPGTGKSEPGGFTAVGFPAAGRAVFYATGPDGWEPFVTDGTPAGTFQLADINPGAADSRADRFTRLGDTVIFSAIDAAGGGVWRTDGTPAGTTKIAAFNSPTWIAYDYQEFNGALYFHAPLPANPQVSVVWRSDGTAGGTGPMMTAVPPYNGGSTTVADGSLWFLAADETEGWPKFDWWRSDGTAAGTVKAIDLPDASLVGSALQPAGDGHYIFFAWNSDNADNEIWWSDGTTTGSRIIKVFKPMDGAHHVDAGFGFRVFGDRVMFLARDTEHGKDFWVTDGTPEGTVPLDLNPGPGTGTSTNNLGKRAVWVGNRLVFQGAAATGDTEPWVTDGTAAGTRKLVDINTAPAGSTISRPFVRHGDGIIFSADNKLYSTDGSPGNVAHLADVNLLNAHNSAVAVTAHSSAALDGVAVFGAISPDSSVRRVYRSDGTPAGTYALGTLDPSPGATANSAQWPNYAGGPFVRAGNFIYFFATDGTRGMELWKTDGTVAGTSIVKDVSPGAGGAIWMQPSIPAMAAVGGTVYFKAFDDELWKSDGTEAGTVRVKDLGFGTFQRDWLHSFVAAGDRLYFEGTGHHLWVSDGTEAGTREVYDRVEVVGPVIPLGGNVYFWGRDFGTKVTRLYRSDGTTEGTVTVGAVLGPLSSPIPGSFNHALVTYGGALYFPGRDAAGGMEMWTSDGTDAGTLRLADIRPGTLDSRPTHIAGFDNRVYFFAEDGTHGRELWSTDGTPSGTRLDQDIYPGPILSSTFSPIFPEPVATGDELFFVAQDDQTGRELRRVTGTPAPAVAGRHLFYNRSAFDGRNAAANVADDGAVAPDKSALLPGQAASFANVSGYSRGINGVMIDIHRVTADLDADDFEFRIGGGGDPSTWAPAPAPLSVTERVPPALAAPTRVTLVWPDGAIRNRWLRVRVKANGDTLLAQDDVFYFGSLVGEGGGDDSPAAPAVPLVVDGVDVVRTRAAISAAPAALTNPFDHNRDGRVSVADVALVRRNLSRALAPVAGPGAAAAPAPTRGANPRRRGAWVGVTTDVLR